ncbi:MAG: redoxin domain-containing protein [Verrucomicrobiota bacterium]
MAIQKLFWNREALNMTPARGVVFVTLATLATLAMLLIGSGDRRLPDQLRISDLTGQQVDPFQAIDAKAIVFIFVSTDCPISNRYAPEVRRLHSEFETKGIKFWLVYPNRDESPAAIRKHTTEYDFSLKVLRDPDHLLVTKAMVHVTPEAAVFLPEGRLIYHGRIDNQYADFGKQRPAATERDLKEVMDAVLAGKTLRHATARAIGCSIPNAQ